MSSDTRGTGLGPNKSGAYDQKADVAEYQRHLDATSENRAQHEEDSQSAEAAEWPDRHPRATGGPGGEGQAKGQAR